MNEGPGLVLYSQTRLFSGHKVVWSSIEVSIEFYFVIAVELKFEEIIFERNKSMFTLPILNSLAFSMLGVVFLNTSIVSQGLWLLLYASAMRCLFENPIKSTAIENTKDADFNE